VTVGEREITCIIYADNIAPLAENDTFFKTRCKKYKKLSNSE